MCRFLHGPRNSVYYFRRPIPERLRPIIGQREWFFSLKVKDREQAKSLVALETVRTDQLLAEAKTRSTPPPVPARLSPARIARELEQMEWDEEASQFQLAEELEQESRIDSQAEIAKLLRIRITGSTADMAPEDAVIARLVRDMQAEADMYRERWAIAKAESVEDSQGAKAAPVLPNVPKSQNGAARVSQGASAAVTITGLFKGHSSNLSPAILKEWAGKVDKFVEFLGHDDAERVTAENVREWRNHVRDEVLSGGRKRAASTVNFGYLSPVRSAFKHGVDEGLIPHDPAKDVARVSLAKSPKVREKDFTADEQRIILTAASAIVTSGKPAPAALVRRWVPWICAYTGARVNEVTQLRTQDVQEVDGHWIINITPEAGRVKSGEFRVVPVHEHLIAQGFLAMVKAQKDGPIFYDPERGDPNSERGQYKKVGERLAAWVRSLGITDPSIKPNHAWRHTFKTIANEVGMSERAADYMQGHSSKGVGRTYGRSTIKALVDQMALIPRFETD